MSHFDVIEYLKDREIKYRTSGKNISSGWVGIDCLWCDDRSEHLGIHLESKVFKCWRCGKKGFISLIIQKIDGVSWHKTKEILTDFIQLTPYQAPVPRKRPDYYKIPPYVNPAPLPPAFEDYLKGRGFPPKETAYKYRLMWSVKGRYKWRILVPVIMQGSVVGTTARHISNAPERYLESKRSETSIDPSLWIFNYDSIINKRVIIVEGAFDAMKMGDEVVSGMGQEWGHDRIQELLKKEIEYAGVLFDAESLAEKRAEQVANNLSAFIPTVELLSFQEEGLDPAELSGEEAQRLKSYIFNRRPK